jgi:hypothetical protein
VDDSVVCGPSLKLLHRVGVVDLDEFCGFFIKAMKSEFFRL